MSLGNVRSPGFVGPSGAFEIRTLTPEGVVVDVDAHIPSVDIKQGSLMDASVTVSSVTAGDVVSLVIMLTSVDDVIGSGGYTPNPKSRTPPPQNPTLHSERHSLIPKILFLERSTLSLPKPQGPCL